MRLLCGWNELRKEVKYGHSSRFKVLQLDIVEDLLDEDQIMAIVVRQGWKLSLVFGVGLSDIDADIKD
jgi:hypothetical protein